MMRVLVLGSGSRGHSVFVEAGGARLLFDCGFSRRQTGLRLQAAGIELSSINAIVISHEHTDHVKGLSILARELPVFATKATASALRKSHKLNGVEHFTRGEWFELERVRILPFSVPHDAADPVGFVIEDGDSKAALLTDLGTVTRSVRHHLKELDLLIVESNHDPVMLREGPYPWELKQRIKSRLGHLSNPQAGELLREVAHPRLKYVMLAHLSENNNTPELARAAARQALSGFGCRILVCRQDEPSKPVRV